MKLYVTDKITGKHIYLDVVANSRKELTKKIGSSIFTLNGQFFSINEVFAKKSNENGTATGAAVGGFVGLLAGPVGILLGGFIGGAIGNASDNNEAEKVELFNNSPSLWKVFLKD